MNDNDKPMYYKDEVDSAKRQTRIEIIRRLIKHASLHVKKAQRYRDGHGNIPLASRKYLRPIYEDMDVIDVANIKKLHRRTYYMPAIKVRTNQVRRYLTKTLDYFDDYGMTPKRLDYLRYLITTEDVYRLRKPV